MYSHTRRITAQDLMMACAKVSYFTWAHRKKTLGIILFPNEGFSPGRKRQGYSQGVEPTFLVTQALAHHLEPGSGPSSTSAPH